MAVFNWKIAEHLISQEIFCNRKRGRKKVKLNKQLQLASHFVCHWISTEMTTNDLARDSQKSCNHCFGHLQYWWSNSSSGFHYMRHSTQHLCYKLSDQCNSFQRVVLDWIIVEWRFSYWSGSEFCALSINPESWSKHNAWNYAIAYHARSKCNSLRNMWASNLIAFDSVGDSHRLWWSSAARSASSLTRDTLIKIRSSKNVGWFCLYTCFIIVGSARVVVTQNDHYKTVVTLSEDARSKFHLYDLLYDLRPVQSNIANCCWRFGKRKFKFYQLVAISWAKLANVTLLLQITN